MLIGALASGVTTHVPNYLMSVGWTTQGTGYLIGAAVGSVLTSILQGILGYGITWMIYAGFAILLFCCVTVALSNGNKLRTVYPDGELA